MERGGGGGVETQCGWIGVLLIVLGVDVRVVDWI